MKKRDIIAVLVGVVILIVVLSSCTASRPKYGCERTNKVIKHKPAKAASWRYRSF